MLSDEAFDYGYDGGVHTARAVGNLTDINHDVEVSERALSTQGLVSTYVESRRKARP